MFPLLHSFSSPGSRQLWDWLPVPLQEPPSLPLKGTAGTPQSLTSSSRKKKTVSALLLRLLPSPQIADETLGSAKRLRSCASHSNSPEQRKFRKWSKLIQGRPWQKKVLRRYRWSGAEKCISAPLVPRVQGHAHSSTAECAALAGGKGGRKATWKSPESPQ